MPEEFDLNKLSRQTRSAKEKPQETREQKIHKLKAEIANLEGKLKGPGNVETFLAKSREDQESEIAAINQGLPESEQYTLEDYIGELKNSDSGPSVNDIRLTLAKQELEELQSGAGE